MFDVVLHDILDKIRSVVLILRLENVGDFDSMQEMA